jgi:5-aminolevulinate synthase
LLDNAHRLRRALVDAGLPVMNSTTHIVPVLIADTARANAISKRLLDEFGIMAVAVNYPTVPRGTERLRLVVTARHDAEMIGRLVAALQICLSEA